MKNDRIYLLEIRNLSRAYKEGEKADVYKKFKNSTYYKLK